MSAPRPAPGAAAGAAGSQGTAALQYGLAMALAGTLGLFVKRAGIGAVDAVYWRCVLGAAVMALVVLARGLLAREGPLREALAGGRWRAPFGSRRDAGLTLLAGVAIAANWVLAFAAFDYVSITLMTIAYHVQPFFVLGLAFLAFGERASRDQVLFVAVAFAGLVLAVRADPQFAGDAGRALTGVGLALAAAFLYGAAVVAAKGVRDTRPEVMTLAHALVGAAGLLPLASLPAAAVPPAAWPWLAGLGVIHTGLVYVLMYAALPRLPSATVAVLTFVYPVTAIATDAIAFGTPVTAGQVAGMALIALATVGVQRRWRWPRPGGGAA